MKKITDFWATDGERLDRISCICWRMSYHEDKDSTQEEEEVIYDTYDTWGSEVRRQKFFTHGEVVKMEKGILLN